MPQHASLTNAMQGVVTERGDSAVAHLEMRERVDLSLDQLREGVSFVIPARNEERYVGRCLDSIARLQVPEACGFIEAIVVDNESIDGTAAVAESRGARVVSVPPGCVSRARNRGAAAAAGKWLAFVDADCELATNWLVHCLETISQPDVLAVGCPMTAPSKDAPWVEKTWFELALRTSEAPLEQVTWLPTFNLLVSAESFHDVGGFDELLLTCEDADFGYRLGRSGRLIRDQRTTTVHHGESKTIPEFFRREAWRSRGNLAGVLRRGVAPGEWLSLLIPPVASLSAIAGATAALAAALLEVSPLPGVLLIGLAAILPAVVVLRRFDRRRGWVATRFLLGYLLAATYLAARSYGLLIAVSRVERAARLTPNVQNPPQTAHSTSA